MKISLVRLSMLAMGLICGAALAASSGSLIRNETLRSKPSASASALGKVSKGAQVEIVGRQGGWVEVRSGKTTGWVRLLSVRAGSGGSAGAGLGDVVGVATTRSNPSNVVAVAGVRGLSEEDLKKAKFNGPELSRMESYGVSEAQADAFARQGGLRVTQVSELPNPQASQSNKDFGDF
jgi:hypothetical protein